MKKRDETIPDERQALYEARAKIIKAIAHPTRLFIVEELEKKEKCVNELTEMIGADMSTVSKHLSVLKNAGLSATVKREPNLLLSEDTVHSRLPRLCRGGYGIQRGTANGNSPVLQKAGGTRSSTEAYLSYFIELINKEIMNEY